MARRPAGISRDQPARQPAQLTSHTVENALRTGVLGSVCANKRRPALSPAWYRWLAVWVRTDEVHWGPAFGPPTLAVPLRRAGGRRCARVARTMLLVPAQRACGSAGSGAQGWPTCARPRRRELGPNAWLQISAGTRRTPLRTPARPKRRKRDPSAEVRRRRTALSGRGTSALSEGRPEKHLLASRRPNLRGRSC